MGFRGRAVAWPFADSHKPVVCGAGGTSRRTRLRAWRPYPNGHGSASLPLRTSNTGDRCESLRCSPARSGLLSRSRQIPAGSLRLHAHLRSSPRLAAAQDQRPPGGPEGDSSQAARPGRVAQYAAVGQQQTASVVTRKSECNSLLRLHSLPLWRRQSARLSEKQEVRVRYPATAPHGLLVYVGLGQFSLKEPNGDRHPGSPP